MRRLADVTRKKMRIGIGVMSGTSLDGIDIGLVRIRNSGDETKVELLAFDTFPIPKPIRERVLLLLNGKSTTLREVSQLNFLIGEVFADSIDAFLREQRFAKDDVDFIASHGQTMWHEPEPERIGGFSIRSTLQLGNGAVIANRLGLMTIWDFRCAEFPHGGEGAPLAPFLDYLLFRHATKNRALLNLGGISNITALKAGSSKDEVIFFDCGAANNLLDKAAQHFFNKPFDKEGALAAKGTLSEPLLNALLREPFYQKKPPKSTGRELFNDAYFERIVQQAKSLRLSPNDVLCTLTWLTVRSIENQVRKFVTPTFTLDQLILAGGGANNTFMVSCFEEAFPKQRVLLQDDLENSFPAKAKESVLFAVLGNELLSGNSASMKTPARLGTISLAPLPTL
jgi:anhydro-N-acetylmuramic acid kinase